MPLPKNSPASSAAAQVLPPRWQRGDWIRTGVLFAVIAAMHVVAFTILVTMVAPHHYTVGKQAFGVGLGITAYTLGMRHAFDADHIAAIDNTTRKHMADGQRPVSVRFWFAIGHSSIVLDMAGLIAAGANVAGTLVNENSGAHVTLGVIGTTVSGAFLYLNERSPIKDVARRTGLAQSRVATSVRSFTERGWVTTSADPDDGRKTLVDLTADIPAAGSQRRAARADRALTTALAAADDDERAALTSALARLHQLLVAGHAPRPFPDPASPPPAPPAHDGRRPA